MRLKNKVAIVTGGSRGIGRAVCEYFAAEGAKVVVNFAPAADTGVFEGSAERVVQAIHSAGGQAMAFAADVADAAQVNAMVAATLEHFGTVDILVNNAGICPFEEFLKMSEQLWDRVHDVNLKGVFLCSQAVARVMVEKKIPGRIICTSSISSTLGGPLQAHYCPTKAGVNLFVKSIAIALGPYGITCNAVAPGPVVTDINRELFGAKSELFEKIVARSPLGRLGTPADIAGPMVFFASDDAAYCTGSILVVDGGIMVNLG